jgi:S1-C subfamily serine protease
MIQELSDLVRSVAAKAGPSVVSVGRHGRGSGVIVATGKVLTCAHNLRDRTAQVRFLDGRTAQGSISGSDIDGDLVVLDVDTGELPPLEWAEQAAQVGDIVVSLGAGGHQPRAAWGQVTAAERGFRGPRGRLIAGAVEHTAPSASGSSGGPVLDASGRVLGINTHRVDYGFYLARAADESLRSSVAAMTEGRRLSRVELGVALAPAHLAARLRRSVGLPERDGLLVRAVVDGSPAAAAGIRKGDLLVRAGGRELGSPDDLFAALGEVQPGGSLELSVVRGVEELTVMAVFPAAAA